MKRTNQKIAEESHNGEDFGNNEIGSSSKCPKLANSVANSVTNGESQEDSSDVIILDDIPSWEIPSWENGFSWKFVKNAVAVRQLLKFLPLRDWISLEVLNKSWRRAMLAQWKTRRELNGKELAVAIRMLNGSELKWREISYLKFSRDRKVRVALLRDWIMSRCSSLTDLKDLFTSCMNQPGDYVHANVLDDFLKFRNLRTLDVSNCSPHLVAVARMFEELGDTLEDVDVSDGMLAQWTGIRNVTGALYSKKEKPSDISLAETNGTLQRCFKSLESLRRLNVSKCELANGVFLCGLPHPEKLTYLDISYSPKLKYKEIINSGLFLRCTRLEELRVELGKSDDKMEKIKAILPSIQSLSTLQTLSLSGWESTKGLGSADVAQALCRLTNLRCLSLENTKGLVKDDFLKEICGRLKQLENLEISVSLLSVQGFKSLERLPVLHKLKLSMGVPKLLPKEAFEVFAGLPVLSELDLGVPAYGTDLSGLYEGCQTLETLKITGMAATDELLLEWAQRLPRNVVNLHIKAATPEDAYKRQGSTPPGDSGLVAILADRGDRLRSLFLARTVITDVGLRKIAGCCKQMTEFGLYATKIHKFTESGLQALLDGCENLTDVYFDSYLKQTFGQVNVRRLLNVKDYL